MDSYDDPSTFRGQLQRGRGIALRRAQSQPQAGDAVYECILDDPRWDRQTESRDAYLAALVRKLDLSLTPIEEHLVAFDDDDPDDIGLLLDVLAVLASSGHECAIGVLRRYIRGGKHRHAALEALELAEASGARNAGTPTRPTRKARAAAADLRKQAQAVADLSRDELLAVVAQERGRRRWALQELGRRGDHIVLDLVEDPSLRNAAGWIPGASRALTHLGTAAVARARLWLSDPAMAPLGIDVLAAIGDHSDVPALLADFRRAFDDDDLWWHAETPAEALGRLQVAEAAPLLVAGWERTVHSHGRAPFLTALRHCAPRAAEILADEGLDDCEPAVQEVAREVVSAGMRG